MAGPIRIAILANGRGAISEMDRVGRSGSRMGGILRRVGQVAAVGLASGLGALAYAAKSFAEGAAEDETAAKLLEGQLKRSAGATDAQVAATERWITAQGKALGISDDQYRPALAKLVTATKDVAEAQDLASLAADVAAARGIDLATASTAISKAVQGTTGGLGRLGIRTKDAAGETLSLTQLVKSMREEFGGAAKTKAETLEGTLDKLKVRLAETGEEIGYRLLPPLADLADKAIDGADAVADFAAVEIVPKLREAAKWYRENKDDLADLARTARDQALPVLEGVVGIVGDAVSIFLKLPAPVRDGALQFGLAALAVSKLRAGVAGIGFTGLISGLASTETRAKTTTAALAKVSAAARTAAGGAGFLVLTAGIKETDRALGTFETTAGGALAGFAVGGPVGAGIGAVAGLVYSLGTKFSGTRQKALDAYDAVRGTDAVEAAKSSLAGLKSTLDQVTGAYTGATRAAVLKTLTESGAIAIADKYGISTRQLVSAAMGQGTALSGLRTVVTDYSAQINDLTTKQQALRDSAGSYEWVGEGDTLTRRMTTAVVQQIAALEEQKQGLKTSRAELEELPGVLRDSGREVRAAAVATADYTGKLRGIPQRIRTKIEDVGIVPTSRGVAKIARQYGLLDRKRIRTLIEASGADTTVKQVQRVIANLERADKVKVKPDLKGGVDKAVAPAVGAAGKGGRSVVERFERELTKTRATMPQLKPSLATLLGGAAGTARGGATGIGTAAKTGFGSGFAGADGLWSAQVRSAVLAAIAAGRAAARAKSPSRETADLGSDMGEGLVVGMRAKESDAAKGARKLIRRIFDQLSGGSSEAIARGVESIAELVRKSIDLKDDKAERKREAAIIRSLRKRRTELEKIGKQQDALQSGNYLAYLEKGTKLYEEMTRLGVRNLDEARAKLDELKQQSADYAATIRSAFLDFGNLVGLGANAAGVPTTRGILAALSARADQAELFAGLITQLRDAGLNETSIGQLIAAGPEQGLAAAQAIAAGGAAAVTQINALMARIDAAGTALGARMASTFYDAGIASAEGIVAGLEAAEDQLDKVARKMARGIIRALRDELKVRSPSRVTQGIGWQATRGLVLGLDATYVKRHSASVAKAMVTGFGTPALEAHAQLTADAVARDTRALRVEAAITADGLHQLTRGRDIVADATAYRKAGGTTPS